MAGDAPSPSGRWTWPGSPPRGEVEAESKAQVTEQLRQRGLIVLDVTEKTRAVQDRGPLQALARASTCASWRSSRASSRPWSPRGCRCCAPCTRSRSRPRTSMIKEAIAGVRARRRGRQLAGAGDGAPPEGLRPPLPGDGPLRRAVGPARGGARPDRLPGREDRRAAAPGEIGADVPGAGLRLRDRRAGRDRRLRHPGLRRHLRRDPAEEPGEERRAADADPDLRRRLRRPHRLLVHHHPGARRRSSSSSSAGRRPNAAASSGTGSSCASRSRSAT